MGLNFNNAWDGVKSTAQGVEDALKENPLETAYNNIRDRINGIGGRSIPTPGNTIGDFFINRDSSLNEGFDDWERLIDFNVTNKEVLDPLIGNVPNDQLVHLANTAIKFNLNSELSGLVEGALTSDPPRAFGRITDLTRRKFVYGINDYVNYIADSLYEDVVDKIEDPTILSFTLELDELNSPLFGASYQDLNNFIEHRMVEYEKTLETSVEGPNDTITTGNVYSSVQQAWTQFKQEIFKFFRSYDSNADTSYNKSKSHYITKIGNINKLDKVWTGESNNNEFELDYLTVEMREDVKMSVRNLAILYNTIRYHQYSGKQLIPENLLRFNMWIKISEVRNFTSLRQYVKGNNSAKEVIRAIKKDVTSIYYYVQDCEFDFNTLHSDDTNQSYSTDNPTEFETLKFKIKFRRAQRMFKPTLLYSTTAPQDDFGMRVFHVDERHDNPFVHEKYYTQEIADDSGLKNLDLPFNALMTGRPEAVFSSYTKTPKQRTIVPDGLVRGSALFRDRYNQNTKDEIGKRSNEDSSGSFLNTIANTALDLGEAYLEAEIGTSIRGLKDTYAQKLIRTTNSSLTRLRNDLVRNLNNKIVNEEVGTPSPKNVYAPTNSKSAGGDATNAVAQQLSPSLQGRPINIGDLQTGFYNLYPINPNSTDSLEEDDRANTLNYIDGKIVSKDQHSTYQTIPEGSAPGSDTIVARDTPKRVISPNIVNLMDTESLKDVHPNDENVMNTDDFDNIHPAINDTLVVEALDDRHPDAANVMDIESLGDVTPDSAPSILVKDLGDRHPDAANVMDIESLGDVAPDGEPRALVKDLGDVHPDGEQQELVKDLGDKHPDDENIMDIDSLGDVHPDAEHAIDIDNVNINTNATEQSSVSIENNLHDDTIINDSVDLNNINPNATDDDLSDELGNINNQ